MVDSPPSSVSDPPRADLPRLIAGGQWAAASFFSARQDIRNGTTWGIQREVDTVIVHLGGRIDRLETELDGCGALSDPPMVGEIWVVPAGQRYVSQATGGLVHFAEMHLSFDAAKKIAGGGTGFHQPVCPRAGCFDPFLHRAALRLEALAQKSDDVSRLAAESLSQAILLDFYGRYGADGPPIAFGESLRLGERQRDEIRGHIQANLGKPLRLESLAPRVNMTVHEFLIAFRAEFLTTPAQYVIDERVRRARWLLLASSKSIAEIAYETGFSSHAHLSTVFRTRVGATPNAFRSEHRGVSRLAELRRI